MAGGLLLAISVGCTSVAAGSSPSLPSSPPAPLPSSVVASAPVSSPSTGVPIVPAPRIDSVANFRDVAADGLDLAGGRRMSTGVTYRSAALNTISDADLIRLHRAGVVSVIDLRTPAEVTAAPDRVPKGARYRSVNLYQGSAVPALARKTVAAARDRMRRLNVNFVAQPGERAQTATVLRLIAAAEGPVLFHCAAGKDRTGWISAVLQLLAGADRDTVVAEYLKSNDYRAQLIAEHYRSTLAAKGVLAARVRRASDRVEAEYLGAGLDEIDRRYGSFERYLIKGLGLSQTTIDTLRARLSA